MSIPVEWTSDLKGEDKENFIKYLTNSRGILTKLAKIITKKDGSAVSQQLSVDSFDKPNWDYRQAYLNGKTAAYKEMLQLLIFNPDQGGTK